MTETSTEPRPTRRPRNPERHKPDGTYNAKPLDPEYFKNYYHKAKQPKECEVCGKVLASGSHMKRHRGTNKCMLIDLQRHFIELIPEDFLSTDSDSDTPA